MERSGEMKSFVSNCLRNVSNDCPPEEMEVVVRKSHHVLVRVTHPSEGSLFIKAFNTTGFKSLVRRALLIPRGTAEQNILSTVNKHGLPSPRLMGTFRFPSGAEHGFDMAIIFSDLSPCEIASIYLEKCTKAGNHAEIQRLSDHIIKYTSDLIRLKIYDIDHGCGNFVVMLEPPCNVARIDFEFARTGGNETLAYYFYIRMLSELVYSFSRSTGYSREYMIYFFGNLARELNFSVLTREIIRFLVKKRLRNFEKMTGLQVPLEVGL